MSAEGRLWQERISKGRLLAEKRIADGEGYIYVAAVPDSDKVKIGFSLDPERRMIQLGYGHRLMGFFPASRKTERALHTTLHGGIRPPGAGHEVYSRDVIKGAA